jgi:hypothetical protein
LQRCVIRSAASLCNLPGRLGNDRRRHSGDGSGNAYITGNASSPIRCSVDADGCPAALKDAFCETNPPAPISLMPLTLVAAPRTAPNRCRHQRWQGLRDGITINSNNNSDFPTTSNRFQGNGFGLQSRGGDVFLIVLNPAGNGLFYSTFFGGDGTEGAMGLLSMRQ